MSSDHNARSDSEAFEPVSEHEVTKLLDQIRGAPELLDRVLPLVYDDLKRIGHNQRLRLGGSETMQTTALVHEACIRLREQGAAGIENRLHLKRLVAMVMRQLLIDYARRQKSIKRGGGQRHIDFEERFIGDDDHDLGLVLAVERIVERMRASNPRMAEIVTARFFAGYGVDDISEMLGVSTRTVTRELTRARAWLKTELSDYAPDA